MEQTDAVLAFYSVFATLILIAFPVIILLLVAKLVKRSGRGLVNTKRFITRK